MVARVVLALCAAYIGGLLASHTGFAADFRPVHRAAQLVAEGTDPYLERTYPFTPWPLQYPGTTLLVLQPLRAIDEHTARVTFVALGAFLFALGLTRDGFARTPLLLGYPFLSCLSVAQFPTWVAVAAMWIGAGWLATVKPNLGLAVLAGMRDRRSFITACALCGVLTLASFVWFPRWPLEWLRNTLEAPDNVPIVAGWIGVPMLLSALKYRDPDARTLLALSLVPQNVLAHATLILWRIPTTAKQSALVAALSWLIVPIVFRHPYPSHASFVAVMRPTVIVCCYLPLLWLVLRRPNDTRSPDGRI